MKFDHKDFAANPEKYKFFSTARVASHIFTNNGTHDIAEGTVLGIKYRCTVWNGLYRRNEPVYSATVAGEHRDLFANCLSDFVL